MTSGSDPSDLMGVRVICNDSASSSDPLSTAQLPSRDQGAGHDHDRRG